MSEPTTVTQGKRWRDAFHKDEVLQRVRPPESRAYLPNPHRGTTTFQRFNGDPLYPGLEWDDRVGPIDFKPFNGNLRNERYPYTTLSYCRWLWSVLEPKRGQPRWEIIDGALEAARVRGQTLQLRVQPYIGPDTPDWYWTSGGKQRADGDPKRREPDHNNPNYLKHFGAYIRAFGKRYDGHPVLESFDIAYGGPCGETGGNTKPAVARRLVDIYRQAFRKTRLISMLGTDGCAHASRFPEIGWRADCLGDMRTDGRGYVPENKNWNHMFDAYPKEVNDCGVTDTWKTAPITLETCWTVGYWKKVGWDLDFIMEQALKYHMSVFMPKSSFIPDEWREKFDVFDRKMGYRFVLRQLNLPLEARRGQKAPYWIFVENVGVAPIYRPYRLALRFQQGKKSFLVVLRKDIRDWLPGDFARSGQFTLPAGLQRGEAQVSIGILDPKADEAKVLFALDGWTDERWHPLTSIDVLS
jgi:hypothetical protein